MKNKDLQNLLADYPDDMEVYCWDPEDGEIQIGRLNYQELNAVGVEKIKRLVIE